MLNQVHPAKPPRKASTPCTSLAATFREKQGKKKSIFTKKKQNSLPILPITSINQGHVDQASTSCSHHQEDPPVSHPRSIPGGRQSAGFALPLAGRGADPAGERSSELHRHAIYNTPTRSLAQGRWIFVASATSRSPTPGRERSRQRSGPVSWRKGTRVSSVQEFFYFFF